jgi:hypothetical protein
LRAFYHPAVNLRLSWISGRWVTFRLIEPSPQPNSIADPVASSHRIGEFAEISPLTLITEKPRGQ